MADHVELLRQLTEASGVPGHELGVRQVMRELLAPLGELVSDRVGSVVYHLKGQADGPRVMLFDARMIPNVKLRDLVMDTATELEIPVQTSALAGGGTDGGAIHLHRTGVPTRHIHSHGAIMHRRDFEQAVLLVEKRAG